MDAIFVPVTCPICKRGSALTFDGAVLKHQLDGDGDITLRCAYDDAVWQASAKERAELLKLWQEQARLSGSEFERSLRFNLRPRAAVA